MEKILPIVAIVGQPNAGKSTLLNKIVGRPTAITSDVVGTTRDRQYADTSWNGVDFTLVDTAGLSVEGRTELEQSLNKQIEVALEQADVIMLVVDGKEPVSAMHEVSLKKFRAIKKPVVLVVNKLDSPMKREQQLQDFLRLGIKPSFAVSSLTGLGLGDLLDEVTNSLKKLGLAEAKKQEVFDVAVSIVGKPNVGKSSIFNAILKEERVVVSPIAGTTRAAIDSRIKINDIDYTFIDTAGLKKKDYRQDQPDVFAGFQTFKAIRRSDICFFVIDASQEITKQDQRIANEIFELQKGCIILANKCDLMEKEKTAGTLGKNTKSIAKGKDTDDTYQTVRDYISHNFPFLWMCPLFFVSAVTGEGLEEALNSIAPIFERRNKTIDNQTLAEFLSKVLLKSPPKLLRDQKKPKVFSLHQLETNPPKFELVVNFPAAISLQFRKFTENSIIKFLDFFGTPITLKLRGKDKS
jgi:GTP-binding protein